MTIVELIDIHGGFSIISDRIQTTKPVKLMWIVCWLCFILAAVLDNLAASIVMVSLTRKLVRNGEQRKLFAGMIILAANAGGLWSPIGSITTTMLWIGGRISAGNVVLEMLLPSIVNLLLPLLVVSFMMRKQAPGIAKTEVQHHANPKALTMLIIGLAALLFVPVFKVQTHLPPYMGMLLSLGVVWLVSEFMHKDKDEEERKPFTVSHALSRIDSSSILFFLGILLAIGCLESMGLLHELAAYMDHTIGNLDIIALVIGLASAVVDNVPLVAASMGMYDLQSFPMDHKLWEFLAYTAGTGGSILIIGSAAGVAVMGMEKIDFGWYMKKISWLALIGYFAGAAVYLGIYQLVSG